jgi:hypothetical protein
VGIYFARFQVKSGNKLKGKKITTKIKRSESSKMIPLNWRNDLFVV